MIRELAKRVKEGNAFVKRVLAQPKVWVIPAGTPTAPVLLKAGDVLFFNGQLVHGSFPNTSKNRFRRSLIGHYIEGDSAQVARWYKPTLRMDGSEIDLTMSEGGSQCGVWVDEHGKPMIEMSGQEVAHGYAVV